MGQSSATAKTLLHHIPKKWQSFHFLGICEDSLQPTRATRSLNPCLKSSNGDDGCEPPLLPRSALSLQTYFFGITIKFFRCKSAFPRKGRERSKRCAIRRVSAAFYAEHPFFSLTFPPFGNYITMMPVIDTGITGIMTFFKEPEFRQ